MENNTKRRNCRHCMRKYFDTTYYETQQERQLSDKLSEVLLGKNIAAALALAINSVITLVLGSHVIQKMAEQRQTMADDSNAMTNAQFMAY